MKCAIASRGEQEAECTQSPVGDCANCGLAWGFLMSPIGPGSHTDKVKDMKTVRDGQDLQLLQIFDDGDPLTYSWRITQGVFQRDEPIDGYKW